MLTEGAVRMLRREIIENGRFAVAHGLGDGRAEEAAANALSVVLEERPMGEAEIGKKSRRAYGVE